MRGWSVYTSAKTLNIHNIQSIVYLVWFKTNLLYLTESSGKCLKIPRNVLAVLFPALYWQKKKLYMKQTVEYSLTYFLSFPTFKCLVFFFSKDQKYCLENLSLPFAPSAILGAGYLNLQGNFSRLILLCLFSIYKWLCCMSLWTISALLFMLQESEES